MKFGFTPEAEILNARLAMLGFRDCCRHLLDDWANFAWSILIL
jgi:hypothetical protein